MSKVYDGEYVAVVQNGISKLIIRCDIKAAFHSSYFTLEEEGGDAVVIFKSAINNLIKEIEKLRDLTEKPKGKKP